MQNNFNTVVYDDFEFQDETYSIHNDELIISYRSCGDNLWQERPRFQLGLV